MVQRPVRKHLTRRNSEVRFMSMRLFKIAMLVLLVGGTVSSAYAKEAQTQKNSWTKIKEIFR